MLYFLYIIAFYKNNIKEEDWSYISDNAKDLVKKMLVKNPENRISA